MDNDELLTELDTALQYLQRAAEILREVDGMGYAARRVEDVTCDLEQEIAELESLED
mgnify:CR=1 FL=1|jgi:hypothetical protein